MWAQIFGNALWIITAILLAFSIAAAVKIRKESSLTGGLQSSSSNHGYFIATFFLGLTEYIILQPIALIILVMVGIGTALGCDPGNCKDAHISQPILVPDALVGVILIVTWLQANIHMRLCKIGMSKLKFWRLIVPIIVPFLTIPLFFVLGIVVDHLL